MIAGEVGAGEPDVGDQVIGLLGGHEQPVALRLRQVVDVRRPRDAAGDFLLGVERGRGLEGILGEDHLHFRGLNAGGDQHVQREVMRGRVLGQHQLLAAEVGHRLDVLADHDAVAAVGEVDLLVDPGHDPAFLGNALRIDEALEEKRHHVERCPADVNLARRVGVTHLDGVVDQHEIHLERFAVGRLPFLAGLEALVGQHDRRPARPDVEREADRVVVLVQRLVSCDALDGRELLGRLELVFLDGGRGGRVGRLGGLFQAQVLGLDGASPSRLALARLLRLDRLGCDDVAAVDRKPDQAQNDQGQGHVKGRFRLSGGHCLCSSLPTTT